MTTPANGEKPNDKPEDKNTPNPTETPEQKALKEQLEKSNAEAAEHIKKLNAESAERRLAAKKLADENEKLKREMRILKGEEEPPVDIAALKKASDAKVRNAFLKAEVASLATDAHDVGMVFNALQGKLGDVDVDIERETVDTSKLTSIVNELKKDKAFLFKSKDPAPAPAPKAPAGGAKPPDGGAPNAGGNVYEQYRQLITQGRTAEAQAFYAKNRADILASESLK